MPKTNPTLVFPDVELDVALPWPHLPHVTHLPLKPVPFFRLPFPCCLALCYFCCRSGKIHGRHSFCPRLSGCPCKTVSLLLGSWPRLVHELRGLWLLQTTFDWHDVRATASAAFIHKINNSEPLPKLSPSDTRFCKLHLLHQPTSRCNTSRLHQPVMSFFFACSFAMKAHSLSLVSDVHYSPRMPRVRFTLQQ